MADDKSDKAEDRQDQQKNDSKEDGGQNSDQGPQDELQKSATIEKTGYKLGEILKSPVEPPNLEKARKPTEKQFIAFVVGGVLMLIGLFLWAGLNIWAGTAFLFIGIVIACYGILVRRT